MGAQRCSPGTQRCSPGTQRCSRVLAGTLGSCFGTLGCSRVRRGPAFDACTGAHRYDPELPAHLVPQGPVRPPSCCECLGVCCECLGVCWPFRPPAPLCCRYPRTTIPEPARASALRPKMRPAPSEALHYTTPPPSGPRMPPCCAGNLRQPSAARRCRTASTPRDDAAADSGARDRARKRSRRSRVRRACWSTWRSMQR